MSAGRREGGGRRGGGGARGGRWPAGELRLERRAVDGDPAIEALVVDRFGCADERMPERRARGRALDAGSEPIELLARVGPRFLGQQPVERVLEVPLALVKLGVRPAL